VSNSKRNWAKFGVGIKLIVILRHIIAYFSINIRWHSQTVSSHSRKWLIKHLFPQSSCKKQINKHNSYILLAFLQSGSVPELDMQESKHFLPDRFVHSDYWWQKSDIWSQAWHRYAISWEAFFGTIRFLRPVCRLSWFLSTLNIYAHFSQQLLMAEIWYLVTSFI
jgi:hypothetical protein